MSVLRQSWTQWKVAWLQLWTDWTMYLAVRFVTILLLRHSSLVRLLMLFQPSTALSPTSWGWERSKVLNEFRKVKLALWMFRSRNKIGQSLPDINLEVDMKAHLYSDAVAGQVDVESGVGRERVISPVACQPGGELAAPVILPHCKQSQSVRQTDCDRNILRLVRVIVLYPSVAV